MTVVKSLEAIFSIIILLTLAYTIVVELAARTMDTFWVRSLTCVPLSSILVHILNLFSPVLRYYPNDPYWLGSTFALYAIFFVFVGISVGIGTLIARLVSGYEALCKEPTVTSYSIKPNSKNASTLLESFLSSVNVKPRLSFKGSEEQMTFVSGPNLYHLFLNPLDNDETEVNFVVLRFVRETILEPSKKGLGTFIAYLESFLSKKKEEGGLDDWNSATAPRYADTVKNRVWRHFTSPLQIRETIALRGMIARRIVGLLRSHKGAIFTFIGGVLTVIIGELVINYLWRVMGL
jgi:hypothetical protein